MAHPWTLPFSYYARTWHWCRGHSIHLHCLNKSGGCETQPFGSAVELTAPGLWSSARQCRRVQMVAGGRWHRHWTGAGSAGWIERTLSISVKEFLFCRFCAGKYYCTRFQLEQLVNCISGFVHTNSSFVGTIFWNQSIVKLPSKELL